MTLKPDNFTEQAQEVLATSQALVNQYQQAQLDVENDSRKQRSLERAPTSRCKG